MSSRAVPVSALLMMPLRCWLRLSSSVIDCHCHAGKGDLLTGPWDTDAPMETYLKRAKAAGINKTVIFSPFHSNYGQANANTARIVARYPDRLLGFAFVHAHRDRGHIHTLIAEAVTQWCFCGIKVHRLDAPLTREICEVAQSFRLPLLYDPMGRTDLIDLLAPQYPSVNFIIPHLGSFADDWRTHLRVIDQIVRYPNVYADTSGVRRFDYLKLSNGEVPIRCCLAAMVPGCILVLNSIKFACWDCTLSRKI